MWLAGHSLGASQALDVGRSMAEKGFNLPTFLFNPPQVSPAPAIYLLRPNEKAKMHLYATSSLLKVGLSKIVKSHEEHMEDLFKRTVVAMDARTICARQRPHLPGLRRLLRAEATGAGTLP